MRVPHVLGCLLLVVILATNASALEIQVSPQTLVLSSPGGRLTVHTDVPLGLVVDVTLEVNGSPLDCNTFADNCGNLVAQYGAYDNDWKKVVEDIIGKFEGKTTTAKVTLTVVAPAPFGGSASEVITVKK